MRVGVYGISWDGWMFGRVMLSPVVFDNVYDEFRTIRILMGW